jgi:uncharacterized glyoxalase superfamily protein PhnB
MADRTKNRSVPAEVVLPHLVYQDVAEAIRWLTGVFGFTEHYRYGGDPPSGAQMRLGDAWIMLTATRADRSTPHRLGFLTQSLTVFIDDVEGHFERAKQAGANILEEPHETIYGEWQYGVEDPEGHHWLFSRHARDVSPESWGATVANPLGETL